MNNFPKYQTKHLLAERTISQIGSYISRGRQSKMLSDAELSESFIASYRAFVDAPQQGPDRYLDFESELLLRKLEPPWNELTPEIERFEAITKASLRSLTKEELAELTAELGADFEVMNKVSN